MKELNYRRHNELNNYNYGKKESRPAKETRVVRASTECLQGSYKNPNVWHMPAAMYSSTAISKSSRPFTDGDFVKECLEIICTEISPEKSSRYNKVPLSRMTIQCRVEDLAKEANEHASRAYFFSSFEWKHSHYTDTGKLLVYVRAVNNNFEITQKFSGLASLYQCFNISLCVFKGMKSLLDAFNAERSKLCSYTQLTFHQIHAGLVNSGFQSRSRAS